MGQANSHGARLTAARGGLVRTATVSDAAAIGRVHVASWRTTYPGLVPADFLAAMDADQYVERWHHTLDAGPASSLVYVLEADGDIFGFASGGPAREGGERYRGELYAIYLLAAAQGRGFGRALVTAVADGLADRGLASMLVWVLRENWRARRFYERLGGAYLREKPLDFGAFQAVEVAYGWDDIRDRLTSR